MAGAQKHLFPARLKCISQMLLIISIEIKFGMRKLALGSTGEPKEFMLPDVPTL
jgi:hypothetical protein